MAWAVGQLGGKAQPLWVSTAARRYGARGQRPVADYGGQIRAQFC